ncbi:hypothetical protein [Roseibium sp. M-1]
MASSTALTHAQTAPGHQPVTAAEDGKVLIKENLFTVSPVLETELSSDTAVPVQLQFNSRPNTAEAVNVEGITAEGFTRKVSVNGEEIAQVVVTRLKKDTDFVDLEANDFTSQFGVDSNRLLPTTAISVNGDEAEFVQAVTRLSVTDEQTEPEKDLEDKQDTAAEVSSVDEAGPGGGENPVAGGYETPERLAPKEDDEEEREPNITFNVSTDGCEPQVDLANGIVRQMAKSETLEDGVVTETEACSPNGIVWNIQRNYSVCEDLIDRSNMVARPQYVSYYSDEKGARYDLAGCQPDTSLSFAISEGSQTCAPTLDFDREVVELTSMLAYRNRSGSEVVVQSCEGNGDTIEMERSFGECEDLVDVNKGVAYRQFKLVYADDRGSVHTVRQCAPAESDGFEFQRAYDDCSVKVDLAAGYAQPQYSLFYLDPNGTKKVVTQCQADDQKRFPIEENASSCTDVVDLTSGFAVPQSRLVFEDGDGVQVVVRECQPSEQTKFQITELDSGCDDLVDFANAQAHPQFTLSYTNAAGKKEIVSECTPDETTSYPLNKSYDGCDITVDLVNAVARPQFRWSYLDAALKEHLVSKCAPDAEKSYQVEEKRNCTLDFDFLTGKATVNTSYVYKTDENVEVSVRECAPSETIDPIQMTADTSNCSLRHDFGSGVSTEMAMWTYEDEGQLFQASPCITTETTYTHSRVFEKNGIDVCTPIVDLAKGQAARQFRTEITVAGRSEVIAGCQPDESAMLGIEATTDGCEDAASFDHDLAAGVSYGRERFFYNVPGQGRAYVTGCKRGEQTFTHSVSPNGWKNDDGRLRAQQLVDVAINVNGSVYKIATSWLQPGTSEIAYSFVRNEDQPDMTKVHYEGCNQKIPTNRTAIYRRPDGSTVSVAKGNGPVADGGDFCQRVRETRINPGWGIKAWLAAGRVSFQSDTDSQSHSRGKHQNAYWVTIKGGNARITSIANSNAGIVCHFYYINREEERLKITEPGTNRISYTTWSGVKEVQDGTQRGCGVTQPIGLPLS